MNKIKSRKACLNGVGQRFVQKRKSPKLGFSNLRLNYNTTDLIES